MMQSHPSGMSPGAESVVFSADRLMSSLGAVEFVSGVAAASSVMFVPPGVYAASVSLVPPGVYAASVTLVLFAPPIPAENATGMVESLSVVLDCGANGSGWYA